MLPMEARNKDKP